MTTLQLNVWDGSWISHEVCRECVCTHPSAGPGQRRQQARVPVRAVGEFVLEKSKTGQGRQCRRGQPKHVEACVRERSNDTLIRCDSTTLKYTHDAPHGVQALTFATLRLNVVINTCLYKSPRLRSSKYRWHASALTTAVRKAGTHTREPVIAPFLHVEPPRPRPPLRRPSLRGTPPSPSTYLALLLYLAFWIGIFSAFFLCGACSSFFS